MTNLIGLYLILFKILKIHIDYKYKLNQFLNSSPFPSVWNIFILFSTILLTSVDKFIYVYKSVELTHIVKDSGYPGAEFNSENSLL